MQWSRASPAFRQQTPSPSCTAATRTCCKLLASHYAAAPQPQVRVTWVTCGHFILPFSIPALDVQVQVHEQTLYRVLVRWRCLTYLRAPGLAGDIMQLEGLLRSGDSGSLAARVAAALGFCVQGPDPGAAPGPGPSSDAQPALQLTWQGHAPPYDAMQLDPPLGGPPCGSFHVLAAAALGEAAGGAAPAVAPPSAGAEPVEGTPRKGPGAGRKAKGTSSSQYRCSPVASSLSCLAHLKHKPLYLQHSSAHMCQHCMILVTAPVDCHHSQTCVPSRGVTRHTTTGRYEAHL